jgi:4-hydroxybenzoate polyprenyltransferase
VLRSARKTPGKQARPVSNVLSLFPGHLLLLLAISLLPNPDGLAGLWAVVPIVSVAYDLAATNATGSKLRTSILIGLYAILWAVLFTLLERVIAIGRGLERGEETMTAVVLGTFGMLFISLGIYRHWRAGKE